MLVIPELPLDVRWAEINAYPPDQWAGIVMLTDGRRISVKRGHDPDRTWARGAGQPPWRRRAVGGRRFDWRVDEHGSVVCGRQPPWITWVRSPDGVSVEDLLTIASLLSVPAEP